MLHLCFDGMQYSSLALEYNINWSTQAVSVSISSSLRLDPPSLPPPVHFTLYNAWLWAVVTPVSCESPGSLTSVLVSSNLPLSLLPSLPASGNFYSTFRLTFKNVHLWESMQCLTLCVWCASPDKMTSSYMLARVRIPCFPYGRITPRAHGAHCSNSLVDAQVGFRSWLLWIAPQRK